MKTTYKEIIKSLPHITYEQYCKDYKECSIESSGEDKIFEDIEDWIEDYEPIDDEAIVDCYNTAKEILVYTTKKFQISSSWLYDKIVDYAEDNFAMSYYDQEPEAMDLLEDFVNEFNKKQYWYVSDELVAVLDASNEVKDYFKDKMIEEWNISENEFEDKWKSFIEKEDKNGITNMV